MSEWAAKRFWKGATVGEEAGGHIVLLDGRPIRTPSRALLVLPTRALAAALAEEWDRQEEIIRPATMPMTRLANTAQDRVAPEFDAVARMVAAYGETDLLCYRAEGPAELVRRQAEVWDPLLDWAAARFGARLHPTAGVVPVAQSDAALDRLAAAVRDRSPWRLTALHEFVALTGSLVAGLAVAEGARTPDEAWTLSRIDEDWQVSQWGSDSEAEAAAARRRAEFHEAVRFDRLLTGAVH
jgi:chaperone required for assembly of F1-ATPase